MHARTALFTLFGDVVRPAGGQAWLSAITAAMGTLGFSPQATRTALHRMTSEGWVRSHRVGRYASYRLTPRAVDRLEEAAARIYRLRAAPWDGRWRLLVAPELARNDPARRALEWMGYGRLSVETWISPRDHGQRVTELLDAHQVASVAELRSDPADDDRRRDQRLAATAWDLTALRSAHRDFLTAWPTDAVEHALDGPDGDRTALALRLRLVHHWRRFLHLDPGLPTEVLPADWLGDVAAGRFAALYERVADASWRAWAQLAGDRAQPGPLPPRNPGASPFAPGLAALHSSPPEPGVPPVAAGEARS